MNISIELVFIASLVIYAILVGITCFWYSKSKDQRTAQENLPKTVKHITEGFVAIIIFLLLFYLAVSKIMPQDVLITLVSVFATAGFLSFRGKE